MIERGVAPPAVAVGVPQPPPPGGVSPWPVPAWLHSCVAWLPGRLAVGTATIDTFNAYRRAWRHEGA